MMKTYPTPWQKKTLWAALTALAVLTLGGTAVFIIWLVARVLSFLQPILTPFAIAAVMAYLLDPVVTWMLRHRIPRRRAVLLVFSAFTAAVVALLLWVIPTIAHQTVSFAAEVPQYASRVKVRVVDWGTAMRDKYGLTLPAVPGLTAPSPQKSPSPAATPEPANDILSFTGTSGLQLSGTDSATAGSFDIDQFLSGNWLGKTIPDLVKSVWNVTLSSVGGFLGVFGFLLSMIIVPLYLYYFLTESARISQSWADYLPLRASRFKDEVVDALTEINGYLIAFFRGQLMVSLINGLHTGLLLGILGLNFWMVIGLMVAVLNIIPYLGIFFCWIPAVLIALAQNGTWMISGQTWWALPLAVTLVFVFVQQVDGFFITPRVVGGSVGLHPMTVIFAVLLWSLLLGGLLGAILAVPLTATLKVLLRRYVWEKQRQTSMLDVAEG